MPSVDDAITLLTDPATPSSFGTGGMRAIEADRVVAKLREDGASDLDARAAGLEALDQIGGRVERKMHTGGQRGGRSRTEPLEVWLVPAKAMRKSPPPG